MGFTHYFPHEKVLKSVWTDILAGCKRAHALLPESIKITGCSKYGAEPHFGADEIWFNGVSDEGHETFSLYRQGSGGFEFCKTARKPYDVLVVACLLIYAHFSPGTIELSSDGERKDWAAGKKLAESALGLAVEIPKTVVDYEPVEPKQTERGWWTLTFTGVDELNDSDREHIAQLIAEGFTSGEIVQENP